MRIFGTLKIERTRKDLPATRRSRYIDAGIQIRSVEDDAVALRDSDISGIFIPMMLRKKALIFNAKLDAECIRAFQHQDICRGAVQGTVKKCGRTDIIVCEPFGSRMGPDEKQR